jgi:hypothetical protein
MFPDGFVDGGLNELADDGFESMHCLVGQTGS